MKELSIEEKARAYDEALGRMKSWARGEHPECFTDAQKAAEFVFPELKKSEEERIKNELVDFIYDKTDTYELREKSNSWLAWLEKQGEHKKFRDSIQIGDKVTRNKDGVLVNLSQLKRIAKHVDKLELVEQSLDWSEEDENRINNLCHFLEEYGNQYYGQLTLQDTISWLKNFKNKVQPHATWKPSKKQMEALDYYANSLCAYCDRQDDLHSLFNALKKL